MMNQRIAWPTIAGTVICILFALLFFGFHFNDINRPPIYFLMLGFAGSLSLALLKQKRLRDVIYINILIYALFAMVASVLRPITAVILLIYYSALILALIVYVRNFDGKLSRVRFARPLVLAGIVGLFYMAANVVHGLMFINHFSTRFLLGNLPIGFLLGLGYGLGDEVAEKYLIK